MVSSKSLRAEVGGGDEVSKQLSQEKKAEILAYLVQVQNNSETARHFGISETTVRNIRKENPSLTRKFEEKNEAARTDALEWHAGQGTRFASSLDGLLCELQNEEKLKDASMREVATVFGIVCDKLTDLKATQSQAGKTAEDDPLTKALNEVLGDGIK